MDERNTIPVPPPEKKVSGNHICPVVTLSPDVCRRLGVFLARDSSMTVDQVVNWAIKQTLSGRGIE